MATTKDSCDCGLDMCHQLSTCRLGIRPSDAGYVNEMTWQEYHPTKTISAEGLWRATAMTETLTSILRRLAEAEQVGPNTAARAPFFQDADGKALFRKPCGLVFHVVEVCRGWLSLDENEATIDLAFAAALSRNWKMAINSGAASEVWIFGHVDLAHEIGFAGKERDVTYRALISAMMAEQRTNK